MKTIKQVADSLKVSKVSVYKAIKKDDIKAHTFKRDNVTYIDETGENLLFDCFNKVNNEDFNENLTSNKLDYKEFKQAENSDLMQKLLNEKDAQINLLLSQLTEKDNQINTLQRLLENQQKLQLPYMVTDGKTKTSFWERFFKKKNNNE